MKLDRKASALVKRLVDLSLEEGRITSARVGAVLEALASKPPRSHRAILRAYRHAVERHIREHTLAIETATPLTEEGVAALVDRYSKLYKRSLEASVHDNSSLIAGLRLRIGDDIYDRSVSGRLDELPV